MNEDTPTPAAPTGSHPADNQTAQKSRLKLGAALAAALALGAGATALAQRGHTVTMVALEPAPVTAMTDGNMVAVKGGVAETFGNKFVLQDASGRALIETGRAGEDAGLVAKGEQVTVQGRFAHGFVHAVSIRHPDGHSDTLDPPPPPRPPGPAAAPAGPDRNGPPA